MALVPIEKSTPSGVKRSYEAPVGNTCDYRRYNFQNKKFSRGNDRNIIGNYWNENRARGSSSKNTPIGGSAQSTPQSAIKRTNTILPYPKCTKRHLGECRFRLGYFACEQEGHFARNYPTQMNKVAAPAPAIQGCPNTLVYNLSEGVIATRPSTLALGQLFVSN